MEGVLLKKNSTSPNQCMVCSKSIPGDERINHDGRIMCGECFIHMQGVKPIKTIPCAYIDAPGEQEIDQAELIIQLIEMVHDHEERIKLLENKLEQLDMQFTSICG